VKKYAEDVAKRMNNAPFELVATAGLLTLAGSINRRIGIRPKINDNWTVYPNLYGMLIAPPSTKKTPILNEMTKPLKIKELEELKNYEQALKEYEIQKEAFDAEYSEYKKSLKTDDPKPRPEPPEKPIKKRLLVNDVTVEIIAILIKDNPNGLTGIVDEIGRLFALLQRKDKAGDLQFYLEAYNGDGSYSVDRVTRDSLFIEHLCLSLFGTTQPSTIYDIVARTNNALSGADGFLQRFQLMVICEHPRYEYTDIQPNREARELYYQLIDKILTYSAVDYGAVRDPYNEKLPPFYRYTSEANEIYKQFSIDLHKQIAKEAEINPALSTHLGKMEKTFNALALILFYADRIMGYTQDNAITKEYAIKAREICKFYETHARYIYDLDKVKERKREEKEERIIEKVKEFQLKGMLPLSYGQLRQKIFGTTAEEIQKALQGIAEVRGKKVISISSNI